MRGMSKNIMINQLNTQNGDPTKSYVLGSFRLWLIEQLPKNVAHLYIYYNGHGTVK